MYNLNIKRIKYWTDKTKGNATKKPARALQNFLGQERQNIKRLSNCSRLKENKEARQPKATHDSELDPELGKIS